VIAGVSVAVARRALIAYEKDGTTVRLKGGRTGVPEPGGPSTANSPPVRTWTLGASSGNADRPVRQSVLRQVVVI
jgi:hypothetical protein